MHYESKIIWLIKKNREKIFWSKKVRNESKLVVYMNIEWLTNKLQIMVIRKHWCHKNMQLMNLGIVKKIVEKYSFEC